MNLEKYRALFVNEASDHLVDMGQALATLEGAPQAGDANELRLLRQRLDFAKARADIPIDSACFCRAAAA